MPFVQNTFTIGRTCTNPSGNRLSVCLPGNNDVLYKLTVIRMPGYDNIELELRRKWNAIVSVPDHCLFIYV